MSKHIVVGICGASGTIYGFRLLQALLAQPITVSLIVSEAGRQVMVHETGVDADSLEQEIVAASGTIHSGASLTVYAAGDLFAGPASGSFVHDGMVIAPCSMKTLGTVAAGIAETLMQRAADVCLKEKRRLILVPREAPLNMIHLRNMIRAAEAGAVILPASPSFYSRPRSIEDLVDTVTSRILDHLDVEHRLTPRWGG